MLRPFSRLALIFALSAPVIAHADTIRPNTGPERSTSVLLSTGVLGLLCLANRKKGSR